MGLTASKNITPPVGMYQHAMNYLETQGGAEHCNGEQCSGDDNCNCECDLCSNETMSTGLFCGGRLEKASEIMDELKHYRQSKSAKAKETVIKSIIETMKDLGIDSGSGEIDDVIRRLEDKIPNPRKGETFKADAASQIDICKKLAMAINKGLKKVYGDRIGDLIDPSGPPEYVCSSVVDMLHSYSSGIYLEYINVYDNVRKVVSELLVAQEILKQSVNNYTNKVKEDDLNIDPTADKFLSMYEKAEQQIELKLQILNGLLQLNLTPSIEELELAMKSEKEGREFVNQFLQPGTDDFGDSISYAITNMGTVASITHMLNKSLKKLDMDMKEYMNMGSLKELEKILDDKLDAIANNPNSKKSKKDDITNILRAIDNLKNYFGKRHKLNKMKGGEPENYEDPSTFRAKRIEKKIKSIKEAEKIFDRTFSKELYATYDNLLKVVDRLGPKIGKEIPVNSSIDRLIQDFYRLSIQDLLIGTNVNKALSGVINDDRAINLRETFIINLRSIIRSIEEVETHHKAEILNQLKIAINDIIKVIERFSKISKVKFGSASGGASKDDEQEYERIMNGGKYEDSFDSKFRTDDGLKLDESVSKMVYYYYVANIREQIKNTKKEYDHYSEGYEKILGTAMRLKRDQNIVKKQEYFEIIDRDLAAAIQLKETTPTTPNIDDQIEKIKATKEYIKDQFDAIDQLYRVVEAVELYLKTFTGKLIENPDEVCNIKKSLESTKIIAKWFSDESGDELFKAFQSTTIDDHKMKMIEAELNVYEKDKPHHPFNIFNIINKSYAPSNKNIAPLPASVDYKELLGEVEKELDINQVNTKNKVYEHINNAVDNFQLLQNLINTFFMIGTFDVSKETALSPRQIFKMLTQFLKVRSLSLPKITPSTNNTPVSINYESIKFQQIGTDISTSGFLGGTLADPSNYIKINLISRLVANVNDSLSIYSSIKSSKDTTNKLNNGLTDNITNIINICNYLINIYNDRINKPNSKTSNKFKKDVLTTTLTTYKDLKIRNVQFYNEDGIKKTAAEIDTLQFTEKDEELNLLTTEEINILVELIIRLIDYITKKEFSYSTETSGVTLYNIILPSEIKNDGIQNEYKTFSEKLNELNKTTLETTYTSKLSLSTTSTYAPYNITIGTGNLKSNPSDFKNDDHVYFAYVIRGMVSKIFVTLGLYQLLESPTELKEISPVRLLIGGGSNTTIIIPEATELYYRVPRLMEYYKENMSFDESNPDKQIIALIDPDMKYNNLFHLFWEQLQPATIKNGTYSDYECRTLITIINELYETNKNIKDILWDINYEINRRIALVTKNEKVQISNLRQWRKLDHLEDDPNSINLIDILPTDDDSSFIGVPSDNMLINDPDLNRAELLKKNMKNKYELKWEDKTKLYAFRDKFNDLFKNMSGDIKSYVKNTYKNIIIQTQKNMEHTSEEQKFILAKKLITGDTKTPTVIQSQALLLHETILYGLTILNGFYQLLTNFEAYCNIDINNFVENDDSMTKLITLIYSLTTDSQKLIQVTYGNMNNLVQFDFNKLQHMINILVNDIRKYINHMRPYVDADVLKQYEGEFINGQFTSNTLQGFEQAFKNWFRLPESITEFDQAGKDELLNKTLFKLNVRLNEKIAKFKTVSRTIGIGQVFAGLIFYNKPIPATTKTISTSNLDTVFDTIMFSSKIVIGTSGLDTNKSEKINTKKAPINIYYNISNGINLNYGEEQLFNSMLVSFNKYVSDYIRLFYDKPLQKIYTNLMQPFISGSLSSAVNTCITANSTNIFPDIIKTNMPSVLLKDPKPSAILFLSNALIIRNLWYSNNPAGIQYFISQNISDIPVYMRESYKVNLPLFIKLFSELITFGEFLKDFMLHIQTIDEDLLIRSKPGVIRETVNVEGYDEEDVDRQYKINLAGTNCLDEKDDSTNFISIIDSILSAASAIKDTCERVLREVADEAIYFQTEAEFFTKFQTTYNRIPVSLLSFSLLPLVNNISQTTLLLPNSEYGSNDFKYNYGSRSVLLDSYPIESLKMPYNTVIINNYNSSVPVNDNIPIDEFHKFINNTINMTRFLVNTQLYKNKYFVPNNISRIDIFGSPISITTIEGGPRSVRIHQQLGINEIITTNLSTNESMSITSYIKSANITDLNASLSGTITTNNNPDKLAPREAQWRLNFIDLNMIPFNPAALMQDIPLANLHNYNYTFKHMLQKYLKIETNSVHETIYQLLQNPYADKLIPSIYDDNKRIDNMMRGFIADKHLGRPKYISDQIYNKSLLHNLYNNINTIDTNTTVIRKETNSSISAISALPTSIDEFKDTSDPTQNLYFPYIKNKNTELEKIDISKYNTDDKITEEGNNRFNTVLVRNLVFITNINRVLRAKLEEDLVERHNIVTSGDKLVNSHLTEYWGVDHQTNDDYKTNISTLLKNN